MPGSLCIDVSSVPSIFLYNSEFYACSMCIATDRISCLLKRIYHVHKLVLIQHRPVWCSGEMAGGDGIEAVSKAFVENLSGYFLCTLEELTSWLSLHTYMYVSLPQGEIYATESIHHSHKDSLI